VTPGGVVNNLYVLQYPYPTDRRVVVGLRTWEFVRDNVTDPEGDVIPVPINELYIHHLSGRVVLGQGTEGVRRSEPDAPYPPPNAVLTGDEGENMIFHIIDLREVDEWLPCIECRCQDENGTYLDIGGGADAVANGISGGVDCCTNCTSLTTPTVDYRMRYNVSFSDVAEPINEILMTTADISPVVGKVIEFDVPKYVDLREEFLKDSESQIQRLVREAPFNEMFQMEFFGRDYDGPDTVKIFRCLGHLHVAAIGMWLEDVETGEMLCNGEGFYGTDPDRDKGFLKAINVDNYIEPKVIPSDRAVRFVTEYNATELHTGVMGMYFLFVSGENEITKNDTALSVDICLRESCDASRLPQLDVADFEGQSSCEDTLADNPACKFGGLCDCDTLINAPESTGCGGVYSSEMGSIQVDSVCAKSCGCAAPKCDDALPSSAICSFGNLCDCETFVNSPESTGCGGVYASNFGDLPINDVCASYCDACPDKSWQAFFQEAFVEELEADLGGKCRYATSECREALHNVFACGMEKPGLESLHPALRIAAATHASRLALKHSKLGSSALHRNEADAEILACSGDYTSDGWEDVIDMWKDENGGDLPGGGNFGNIDDEETSSGFMSSHQASLLLLASWFSVAMMGMN
jgi:hypothetical protein